MELCSGGDLLDAVVWAAEKDKVFNESLVAEIIEKLLKAILHCHDQGIVHRDIKAENIMIGEDNEIKLADFGLSHQCWAKNAKMKEMVGTPYYVAPEVLNGKYTFKCDLWSIGVLTYILLSGYIPFNGDTVSDVFAAVEEGVYSLEQKEWKKVTPDGIDFVKKLLTKDYKKRPDAWEILAHPWFETCRNFKHDGQADPLDEGLMENLVEYWGSSRLKWAALNILVKMLPHKEI